MDTLGYSTTKHCLTMATKPETIRALMTLVDKHTDDLKEGEYLDICEFLKQCFEQVNHPTTPNEWFTTPAGGWDHWVGYQGWDTAQHVVATGWITNRPTEAELARQLFTMNARAAHVNTTEQTSTLDAVFHLSPESSTTANIAEHSENTMDEVNSGPPPPPGIINGSDETTPPPLGTGAYDRALARLNAHNTTRHRPSPTDWITVITETAPPGAISPRIGGGSHRVYLEQIKREINEYSTRTGWTPPDTFDVLVRQQMERRVTITRERLEERVNYWRAGTRGVN